MTTTPRNKMSGHYPNVSEILSDLTLKIGDEARTNSTNYEVVAGGTGVADGVFLYDMDNALQLRVIDNAEKYVKASGAQALRKLGGWTRDIDGLKGPDYDYGSNLDLARSYQDFTVGAQISNFKNSTQTTDEDFSVASRLFIKQAISASGFEAGQRLIDPDYYDISFTVDVVSTGSLPSVISQSISATAGSREMQIYHDYNNNRFSVLLRGNQQNLPYTGGDTGNFRIKYSDSENELTLYRDGVVETQLSAAFAGTGTEPTATTVIGGRHTGDLVTYTGGYAGGVLSNFKIYEKRQVVVIGASIMNGAFSDTNEAVKYLHTIGSSLMDLKEFAVAGDTTSDTLAALPATLASITTPSLFIVHTGGNNITQSRPFAGASSSEIQTIYDDVTQIIGLIKAAGHEACLANITFRNYAGMASDNEGSLPYNKAIYESLIKSLTPEWWDYSSNEPVLNLYKWAEDNQALMQADGVHFTAAGYTALREFILDTVSGQYEAPSAKINLDNISGLLSYYRDANKAAASLDLKGVTSANSFIGVNGVFASDIGVEGIGSQLLLKNNSASTISAGDYVDASSLVQVYFDATGVLTDSVDPLPAGSSWRMISGGTLAPNTCKTFIRVS